MIVVYNHWNGLVDWNGGLDQWTGPVDWTVGLTFFVLKITFVLSYEALFSFRFIHDGL